MLHAAAVSVVLGVLLQKEGPPPPSVSTTLPLPEAAERAGTGAVADVRVCRPYRALVAGERRANDVGGSHWMHIGSHRGQRAGRAR